MRSQSSCCENPSFVVAGAAISTIRKLVATVYSFGHMMASGIGTTIGATCLAGVAIAEYPIFGGLKVLGSGLVLTAGAVAGILTCLVAGTAFAGHSLLKGVGGVLGLAISGIAQVAAFVAEPIIKVAGVAGSLACGALAGASSIASLIAGTAAIAVLAVPASFAYAGCKVLGSGLALTAGAVAGISTCLVAGTAFAGHSLLKGVGGVLGLAISGIAQVAAFVAEPIIKVAGVAGSLACGALAGASSIASLIAGTAAIAVLAVPASFAYAGCKVLGSGLALTAGAVAGISTCLGAVIGFAADVASFAISNVAILAYNSVTTNPIEFQELNTTNTDKIWEYGTDLAKSCFATSTYLFTKNWEDVGAIITSPTACIFDSAKNLGNLSLDLIMQKYSEYIADFATKAKHKINQCATDFGKESLSLLSTNWAGENSPCQTAKTFLDSGFGCAGMLSNKARDLFTKNWEDVGAIITSPTACIFDSAKNLGNLSLDLIMQKYSEYIADFATKAKHKINQCATDFGKESLSLLSTNWAGENSPCQTAKTFLDSGFGCAGMLSNKARDLFINWQGFGKHTSDFYEDVFKPWAESFSDHSQKTLCRGVAAVFEATIVPQYLAYQGEEESEAGSRLGIGRDKWAEWAELSCEDSWQKWFCKNAASPTLREIVSAQPIVRERRGEYRQVT